MNAPTCGTVGASNPMRAMITAKQAEVDLHNWKMMHPVHTPAELRAAAAAIYERIAQR